MSKSVKKLKLLYLFFCFALLIWGGGASAQTLPVSVEKIDRYAQSFLVEGEAGVKKIVEDLGGYDTYTVLSTLAGDVEVRDNQEGVIILPAGLVITSARFMPDWVRFTVNGYKVTFTGKPGLCKFVFAGSPLNSSAGVSRTFEQAAQVFGTYIPSAGSINDATITGTIKEDGGIEGGASGTSATFSTGNDVTVKSASIDDNGGNITVTGTGTTLDGVKIVVPPGALQGSTEITVGYNTGTAVLPPGISSSGRTQSLTIHTNGSSNFSQLVEITVPYENDHSIPVPFYVDENNHLMPVLVTNIDRTNRTFTFVTSHASLWTWVVDVFTDSPDLDTGFRSADDGFQIVNYGSLLNNGGECFGMTTFAQWYYNEKMESIGDLYGKYMNVVGSDSAGRTLTAQDVIATRSHSAINQSWTFTNDIIPYINIDDEYKYNSIITALKVTNRPVNLFLLLSASNNGHAVLAFGADENDGQIFIYDPNHPGESKQIIYDSAQKKFQNYENYSRFFLNGTGTYSLKEAFENIFQDAEHNFTSDNHPSISVTSHQNGGTVSERNINLAGKIESSEVLITKLDVFVENTKFSTDVSADGNFSLGVSLNTGSNHIRFVTFGLVNNVLTEIHGNNYDANPFTINLALNTSVMLVTLTWDKDATDVDLYVIDPLGDYSCYYHKSTGDGGELDYDITTGFGPEHWTLSSNDTIRWDLDSYKIRVHYYGDRGLGGTNYKLLVKLYEGTDREVEYTSTGYLSSSNSSNDTPSDAGDDWAEFTFPVTLTSSPNYRQELRNNSISEPLRITAEIPSAEIREKMKKQ